MINTRCLEMISIKTPWKSQDLLVLYLPTDKVISLINILQILVLKFDDESNEFKIFSMHNFENNIELT